MKKKESAACAEQLWALADPLRLQVVQRLFERPCNVSELCEATGAEMVTVSHHLKLLREAELVQNEKSGQHVVYRIHDDLKCEPEAGTAGAIDLGCCRFEFRESKLRRDSRE